MTEENTIAKPKDEILSPEDQIAQLQEKVNGLTKENEELVSKWKHTAADFDNFMKRKEKEARDILEFAKEASVYQLLPSLQSLEQVLNFAPTDDKYKDWIAGLRATIIQLEKTMEALGVVKIKTLGEKFDPHMHEAVEEVETEDEGKIVREIQPGFTINGRIAIPAKVAVGKKRV
jgi:molecular chaperone GrpE